MGGVEFCVKEGTLLSLLKSNPFSRNSYTFLHSSSLRYSLHIDLVNYDSKFLTLKNGTSRELPDFEVWRKVEKELDINQILVRKV